MKSNHLIGYPIAVVSSLTIGVLIGINGAASSNIPEGVVQPMPQSAAQKFLAERTKVQPIQKTPEPALKSESIASIPTKAIDPAPPLLRLLAELQTARYGDFRFTIQGEIIVGKSNSVPMDIRVGAADGEINRLLLSWKTDAPEDATFKALDTTSFVAGMLFENENEFSKRLAQEIQLLRESSFELSGRQVDVWPDLKEKVLRIRIVKL